MNNSRQIALQILLQVAGQGKSLDTVIDSDWYQTLKLDSRDLAFARELANGVCRWFYLLRNIAGRYLKKPLKAKDRDIELVILLGIYQLLVLETGEYAAVNETVELVVKRRKIWAKGLVNGVLRNVIRNAERLADYEDALSYSDWMQGLIQTDWGDQASLIFSEGNHRAPMTLRVNTAALGLDEAMALLTRQDVVATPHELIDSAIVLQRPMPVEQIPGFDQGLFSVQDAAAQLAAPLLAAQPGSRVLDACAAPGGKGLHLKQLTPDLDLTLLDISDVRLRRVRQNLDRAGIDANLVAGDASQPDDWWTGKAFDYVLVDVPCSGSGVIRRHPDIKLHRKEDDVLRLCDTQRKILCALWSVLKPGGRMLYSTCSIFSQENEAQMLAFMDEHPDSQEIRFPGQSWGERREAGYRIAPGSHDMDGFYYAGLQKLP